MDLILHNGTIVTAGATYDADIGIEHGRIKRIGRELGPAAGHRGGLVEPCLQTDERAGSAGSPPAPSSRARPSRGRMRTPRNSTSGVR